MNEIEEREALQKLSSGVDGLDELLRGGLPENRVTMVAGSSGTGKTLFALQAACHWAHAGKRVVFVSTEEAEEDLLATGELLGFRSRQARAEGSLTIVDISTPAPGSIMVTGDFDVRALEKRLEQLTEYPPNQAVTNRLKGRDNGIGCLATTLASIGNKLSV